LFFCFSNFLFLRDAFGGDSTAAVVLLILSGMALVLVGLCFLAGFVSSIRIRIDGTTYENDVILDRGEIRKRKKKPSRKYREQFGHTPVSLEEKIPWSCKRLVIGTGMNGRLPVMEEVLTEADRRGVQIIQCPTREAVRILEGDAPDTNAILHVTC
jgi:hypothetical protein